MREPGVKEKGARKTIRIVPSAPLAKPAWIRVRAPSAGSRFYEIKDILRQQKLHTVCEEASCPNIGECFGKGTATFMILGDICTRRCPFCDVAHGRPLAPDADEPRHLAETIAALRLNYVVITSVDRDDLRDGGAQHFVDCIRAVRELSPRTTIEVLVPDFRGLLQRFKRGRPAVPTKSGLMVGLGETDEEIIAVMRDLRAHDVDMLTIGQYLQPSPHHLPVERYVEPAVFSLFEKEASNLGFRHAAVGALVRSSYHADQQAHEAGVA